MKSHTQTWNLVFLPWLAVPGSRPGELSQPPPVVAFQHPPSGWTPPPWRRRLKKVERGSKAIGAKLPPLRLQFGSAPMYTPSKNICPNIFFFLRVKVLWLRGKKKKVVSVWIPSIEHNVPLFVNVSPTQTSLQRSSLSLMSASLWPAGQEPIRGSPIAGRGCDGPRTKKDKLRRKGVKSLLSVLK